LGILSMFLDPLSPWIGYALGSLLIFLLPEFISKGFNVLRILLVWSSPDLVDTLVQCSSALKFYRTFVSQRRM
jgi:hypothetical protein